MTSHPRLLSLLAPVALTQGPVSGGKDAGPEVTKSPVTSILPIVGGGLMGGAKTQKLGFHLTFYDLPPSTGPWIWSPLSPLHL